MKRLLGLVVLLAIVIGAISSHSKTSTTTTSAANEPAPAAAAPATTSAHHQAAHVKYTSCDQNISVGPATTCGFADNVFRAFAREINEEDGASDHTVQASSQATGKSYTMVCRTREATTLCTGGHAARVRFPLAAAEIYYQTPNPTSPESEVAPSEEPETEPEAEEAECTNGSYINSSGNTVCSPEESPSGPPAGATAECGDGTYSFSEHRSGTCSSHGGVATWLE